MNGGMVTLKSADGFGFGAFHVPPAGRRRGGVILVQEIFGVTDHIRDLARRMAAEGYEVLSPSLYDRLERGFTADYSPEGIARAIGLRDRHPMETSIADVAACRDALAGPVFVMGFCYGGSVSWVAACRLDGLAAASGFYGRLVIDHVEETPRCPVILHFGRTDAAIPMDWVETIAARHPGVPVHVYEAGHGFVSDRRTDYHAASAETAWARTLALFHAHGG